jgi:hypothetical protein
LPIRGWWQGTNLPLALRSLIGIESAAKSLGEFELTLFPGLLQTRDYAEAAAHHLLEQSGRAKRSCRRADEATGDLHTAGALDAVTYLDGPSHRGPQGGDVQLADEPERGGRHASGKREKWIRLVVEAVIAAGALIGAVAALIGAITGNGPT